MRLDPAKVSETDIAPMLGEMEVVTMLKLYDATPYDAT
jgi:hypothetical protein